MLLREKDKQTLMQIFADAHLTVEVWAYGSRVTGNAHTGSDLDLVIRSSDLKKLPINFFMELKDKITQSNIPIIVELFDWARLPESFHRNIEAKHEVIFSNLKTEVNEPPTDYKSRENNSGD